jgi:hypothetical protein
MRKLVLAGAAILALTGCSKGSVSADTNGDGKITSEEMKQTISKSDMAKLKPGEWEMTVKVNDLKIEGLPEETKAKMKESSKEPKIEKMCITKEQIEKETMMVLGLPSDPSCKYEKLMIGGGAIDTAIACTAGPNASMKMKVNGTYTATTYKTNMDQTIAGGPMGTLSMKGLITAKRLGDCPK